MLRIDHKDLSYTWVEVIYSQAPITFCEYICKLMLLSSTVIYQTHNLCLDGTGFSLSKLNKKIYTYICN